MRFGGGLVVMGIICFLIAIAYSRTAPESPYAPILPLNDEDQQRRDEILSRSNFLGIVGIILVAVGFLIEIGSGRKQKGPGLILFWAFN
jgi:hypothetical protein